MVTQKLHAGDVFPEISTTLLSGEVEPLAKRENKDNWKMVIVYRGKHCPLCTKYLNELERHHEALRAVGVEILAVSADSEEQLRSHMEKLEISFPIAYGLTIDQMKELGLYITIPRSEQETDHNFSEPGLFVINQDNNLQIVDISNIPFARPELATLLRGIQWVRNPDNDYPIRGTFN